MSSPVNQNPPVKCFSGVDVSHKDFTAALLQPGQEQKDKAKDKNKPKLVSATPFAQTAEGFAKFIAKLNATGYAPSEHLIVMEATGAYWIALAVALCQAGFAVSVINPAQAHFLPFLNSNGLKMTK